MDVDSVRARASWISSSGTVCGIRPVYAGWKNACAASEQRLDHHELPDLDRAGEDQHRHQRVQAAPGQVGRDHDSVAGQPVGPHAAEQEQTDQRQRLGGEHQPEIGGRASALGDEQGQRDHDRLVADRAGRLTQEQISEIGVAQDAQVGTHDTLSTGRNDGTTKPPRETSNGGG